ncbi:MAG: YebC/PmpR family DNA-binding transcriptional regulator [Firmicutes bacterium]|jgi:YebC/PmpR family DNA-binding regulatory protein|nr:YebC/PmpR family DNA-binding transcriptional regulator [Bacillota bacterium]MDY5586002.1 YebC/PmpR family DNA-binding transcriptional regulator [Eubacteriales bacterium]
MSGHSKWHNIKNAKEKSDAQKGKIFTKIGREIAVAVKTGGADPETNGKLKDLISKAKQNNMPNDTISRSIKKASGELGNINYEECSYEGYGVGGSAVIVRCLTDNKNRTAGDVRHAFDKFGGSLGSLGCVSFLFDRKGVLVLEKGNLSEDDVLLLALDADAEDVKDEGDVYEIVCAPENLTNVKSKLEESGLNFISSEVEFIPQNYVDLDEKQCDTFQKMVDKLEESDDVQEVIHNVNLDDEE